MLLEAVEAPIGIDVVSRVIGRDVPFVPASTIDDRQLIEPFLDVAERYGGDPLEVLVRPASGPSSADLSLDALRRRRDAGTHEWLLLAQSDPDRDAILAPLARLHEEGLIESAQHFGLTHLGANAAVDAVILLSWLLTPGEQALLVLTDQRILAPSDVCADRLPARDSAVVLRVRHGSGALRLSAGGSVSWTTHDFSSAARFEARLSQEVEQIRRAGLIGAIDRVIAQNLFAGAGDHEPLWAIADFDLGSGDVWHRLGELLCRGAITPGQRVLVAATGGIRRVSYALLEVSDRSERGR
jgi:hypothetical protein